MQLHEGDKIEVADGVLADTNAGTYWVAYVSYCHGAPYYGLRRLYSRCIDGRFFANTIDSMLGSRIRRVTCSS